MFFLGYGISGPMSLLRGGYTLPQIPQMPLPLDTLLSLGYPIPWIPYLLDTLPHKSLPSGCLTPWIPYPMDTIPSLDVLPPGYPNPPEPLDTLPSSSSYPTSYLLDTIPSLDVLPPGNLNPPNPWIPYPPDTLPLDPYPLDTIPSLDVLPPIYPNPPPEPQRWVVPILLKCFLVICLFDRERFWMKQIWWFNVFFEKKFWQQMC